MKTTAAILVETGKPLEVAELQIPPLKPGQMLVEITESGVCHTQLLEARGHRGPDPFLPHCLGHEASGVVLEIGAEVTRAKPGDRVILSWMKSRGRDVPGTTYSWRGRTVNAGGVTTFQQHAVVSENRLTLAPEELDPRDAALLGCAFATGFGAATHTAHIERGETVAVLGAGGVGLCSVAGAVSAGAAVIIGIDVRPDRLEAARALGATHLVNAGEGDVLEHVKAIVPGGLDAAIEATGRPAVMQQALKMVRPRGGRAVIVGNARFGESLQIDPRELNQGKRLLGSWGGDNDPDSDFPKYAQLLASGQVNLAPLYSPPYRLEDVNQALADLESGRIIRPLIDMRLA
jgi:S-(hydroxymethyl)glutathione dehydrogenase/alcohol dehydrogenase